MKTHTQYNKNKLPQYRCHKVVEAVEIGKIEGTKIFPLDEDIAPIDVGSDFIEKHPLNQAGYLVIYEDGYQSFSPKDVFENGYTLI